MASEYTPVLGLSKWAAEDMVCREDFNGDNQKIESAYGELITKMNGAIMTKLFESEVKNTDETIMTITFDLSQINWQDYQYVYIDFALRSKKVYFLTDIRINGLSERNYTFSGNTLSTSGLARVKTDPKIIYGGRIECSTFLMNMGIKYCTFMTKGIYEMPFVHWTNTYSYDDIETISFVSTSSSSDTFDTVKLCVWGKN